MNTSTAVGIGGRGKDNIHIYQPGELGIQLQRIPVNLVGSGSNRHIRGLRFRSGGVALACSTLADKYLAMGVNPEILHRIASCACIVLDSLPWNAS